MVLYSTSRWSSVNYMSVRLNKAKRVITGVVAAVVNEKAERGIDETYELPADFVRVVMDASFWKSISHAVGHFDTICKCIGVLESNGATLATAYACFVYVYMHLVEVLEEPVRGALLTKLVGRWGRIYTPVRELAFFCDPFYHGFRANVVATAVGVDAVKLGVTDLRSQARNALQLLTRMEADPDKAHQEVLGEFMRFCVNEDAFAKNYKSIAEYHPQQIWAQAKDEYPRLSRLMIKVYCSPGSSAGVERQHKVAKRVHSSAHNRTGAGKVERQVSVVHNAATALIDAMPRRHRYEKYLTSFGTAENEEQVNPAGEEKDNEVLSTLLTPEAWLEQDTLSAMLSLVSTPGEITDDMIFGGADDE